MQVQTSAKNNLMLKGKLVFDRIKETMSKGVWHSLAVIIVMLVAGPEVIMSIELMAMVELLGASTFVLMYASGLKLFFANIMVNYKKFERYSIFFVPCLSVLKQMPSLVIHVIPEPTLIISGLSFITVAMSCSYISYFLGI